MSIKTAIQGVSGCFHEVAAFKYFGERQRLELVECHSFEEMFRQFAKDDTLYGVMAIENTVAGGILPNYAKLMESKMTIIGEVYLRIEHYLLANEETDIKQLKEIRSHQMALLQCRKFLNQYPQIQAIETADTALSAKELAENPDNNIAVIASHLAGERYKLKVLAKGVETNRRNFTRFLILQNKSLFQKDEAFINKASICFKVGHTPGSLAKVLTTFAQHELNLTKIQSLPVIGREWEYLFLVDLEFSQYAHYKTAINDCGDNLVSLQVLGEYQIGIKHRSL